MGTIRWSSCMEKMQEVVKSAPIVEVGPSKTLCGMNRKMGIKHTVSLEKVQDLQDIEKILKEEQIAIKR